MKNQKGFVVGFILVGVVIGMFATFVGHLNSEHPHVVTVSK